MSRWCPVHDGRFPHARTSDGCECPLIIEELRAEVSRLREQNAVLKARDERRHDAEAVANDRGNADSRGRY